MTLPADGTDEHLRDSALAVLGWLIPPTYVCQLKGRLRFDVNTGRFVIVNVGTSTRMAIPYDRLAH